MDKTKIKQLYDQAGNVMESALRLGGERETNTPKKFRQWVTAQKQARMLALVGSRMIYVARQAEIGKLPDYCDKLITKAVFLRLAEPPDWPSNEADKKFLARYGMGTAKQFEAVQAYLIDRVPDDDPPLESTVEYRIRALVLKDIPNFYPTPPDLAAQMVEMLGPIPFGATVWEPSAGTGALLDALFAANEDNFDLITFEIHPALRDILLRKEYPVSGYDVFGYECEERNRPDYVLMNPPFYRGEDIDHVNHMWTILKPGGMLVSVVSSGSVTGTGKKQLAFRALVDEFGGYEMLPAGTFDVQPFPTKVNTALVWLEKPGETPHPSPDTRWDHMGELAEKIAELGNESPPYVEVWDNKCPRCESPTLAYVHQGGYGKCTVCGFDTRQLDEHADQPELARERAIAKGLGLDDSELPNAVVDGRMARVGEGEQLSLIPDEHYEIKDTVVSVGDLPSNSRLISPPPDRALVNDIRDHGIMYPIVVQMDADGRVIDVVDGRRRVKAARELGFEELPALYAVGAPRSWLVGRAVNLNAKRSPNPLSEYDAIQELFREHGLLSDKQIALGLGIPLGTVQKRLKLHTLYEPLVDVIRAGDMAVSTGEKLAGRPLAEQQQLWHQYNATRQEAGKARITSAMVEGLREVTDAAGAQTLFDLGVFSTPDADPMPVGDWIEHGVDVVAELDTILAVADQIGPEQDLTDTLNRMITRIEGLKSRLDGDLPF